MQNQSVRQETGIPHHWLKVLDECGVQFLVFDRQTDGDLVKLFRSQPGWSVDFEEGVLFARVDGLAGTCHLPT